MSRISNIALKRFNMKMIRDDSVVVLIGKRNTGKSWLVKDLMFHMQHIPVGTVISATEMANGFTPRWCLRYSFGNDYDDAIVEKAMAVSAAPSTGPRQAARASGSTRAPFSSSTIASTTTHGPRALTYAPSL